METKIEELENTIIGQIGMLNDLSVCESKESAKELIDRSRAMSDLIGNYIEIQKTKIDSQRLNIEAQKVKVDTVRLLSENGSITAYEKYLGIEEPIPAIKG